MNIDILLGIALFAIGFVAGGMVAFIAVACVVVGGGKHGE